MNKLLLVIFLFLLISCQSKEIPKSEPEPKIEQSLFGIWAW